MFPLNISSFQSTTSSSKKKAVKLYSLSSSNTLILPIDDALAVRLQSHDVTGGGNLEPSGGFVRGMQSAALSIIVCMIAPSDAVGVSVVPNNSHPVIFLGRKAALVDVSFFSVYPLL